jgi:hypothetical protein
MPKSPWFVIFRVIWLCRGGYDWHECGWSLVMDTGMWKRVEGRSDDQIRAQVSHSYVGQGLALDGRKNDLTLM